ncbi:MAG: purine-nucleoside phosphorylase [Bacteroidales bacterium]|jgi:purine-nucleoside phosphorylase|nr:purine-nucleoside phosphorylase [Bacteroidales bacterium]
MLRNIELTANFLTAKLYNKPTSGIILGSGLGGLVEEIDVELSLPYSEVPGFSVSTVAGHSGRLIFGQLNGRPVVAMQGRFHYYEGWSMQEVTFPVRVMKALGVVRLFVSNAAGGLNPAYRPGTLMAIADHINLFPEHPLRGKNDDALGPRFPDMNDAYDPALRLSAHRIAKARNIELQEGVYAGMQGPAFETPAECRMLRMLGADAVGMSTVPEVIVARHSGLRVFGISVITNINVSGSHNDVSHHEVQQAAAKAQPVMSLIIRELIAE